MLAFTVIQHLAMFSGMVYTQKYIMYFNTSIQLHVEVVLEYETRTKAAKWKFMSERVRF